MSQCTIDQCEREAHPRKRGLCQRHYDREMRRRGTTARVTGTNLRVVLPPTPHDRTIVATSCTKCLRLLPPGEFHAQRGKVAAKCKRCVSWGKAKIPAEPSGRSVIAATCSGCGELEMASGFYPGETTRCKRCSCVDARSWQQRNPDRARDIQREAAYRRQDQSVDRASNWGKQWTGSELEIIARDDLTIPQMAAMLGRTVYAVSGQRHLLHKDPRKRNMAGL